jgi:hypothetical protein
MDLTGRADRLAEEVVAAQQAVVSWRERANHDSARIVALEADVACGRKVAERLQDEMMGAINAARHLQKLEDFAVTAAEARGGGERGAEALPNGIMDLQLAETEHQLAASMRQVADLERQLAAAAANQAAPMGQRDHQMAAAANHANPMGQLSCQLAETERQLAVAERRLKKQEEEAHAMWEEWQQAS